MLKKLKAYIHSVAEDAAEKAMTQQRYRMYEDIDRGFKRNWRTLEDSHNTVISSITKEVVNSEAFIDKLISRIKSKQLP
jgi:hypothetical protein